jgi:ABC-type sugar transport system substrate-binding protein
MKKRILAIILAAVMALGMLAGCGSSGNTGSDSTSKTSSNSTDVKKVKIGVILYNYTDIQGKEIKNYCDNYLSKEFPVSFEYQTAASGDNEAHLRAVDALISTGCNAVMSGYDTVIGESMEKCDSAGVYYGILFGEAKNESDKDGKYNSYGNWGTKSQSNLYYSDYFLGGIYQFGNDHGLKLGQTYGDAVVKAGVKKVGAISFPAFAFSDAITICKGFTEVLDKAGVAICSNEKTKILPAEAGFMSVGNDTKAYIAKYKDMDGLFGLSSGMDMVLPAVNEAGRLWSKSNSKAGSIKIASLGYNNSSAKYLEDGTLIIGGTNNYVESVAYLFTMMFDAANGHNMKKEEGSRFSCNATINYPTFSNSSELKDMETYMLTTVNNDFTKCSVSSKEIKSVMKTYGGSGAWADLSKLVSRSVKEIKEARQ